MEKSTAPPVPIDRIVELHLKLTLEIKDLQLIFGFGDVHGAIWFRTKRVGIDQRLTPTGIQPSVVDTISRLHMRPATGGYTDNSTCVI